MRNMIHRVVAFGFIGLFCVIGCGRKDGQSSSDETAASVSNVDATAFLTKAQPEGAINIIEARNEAQDEADVVVTGRIGGSVDPWVEGLAAFSVVDLSLTACNDTQEEHCKTPWDYCCEAELPQARVLVKFVDKSNTIVKTDARQLFGLKELQVVVVRGKAKRDESDNLTILANSLFIVE